MKSNKNVLKLIKRGCDFLKADYTVKDSDLGNYRVFVEFIDKNGTTVYGDFLHGVKYRYYSLRGHKPLKMPIIEHYIALYCDLQYTEENGNSYVYKVKNIDDLLYTKADILQLVNRLSMVQYDTIIIE